MGRQLKISRAGQQHNFVHFQPLFNKKYFLVPWFNQASLILAWFSIASTWNSFESFELFTLTTSKTFLSLSPLENTIFSTYFIIRQQISGLQTKLTGYIQPIIQKILSPFFRSINKFANKFTHLAISIKSWFPGWWQISVMASKWID